MAGVEADEQRNGEKTAELEGPGPVALAFGAKIRSARKTAGLSLRAFAQEFDAAHGHLSNIEQGKAKPSWNLMRRVDALLGMGGDLLSAYPELLSEWDARKRKRKRALRRPVGERATSSRIGANGQRPRYADEGSRWGSPGAESPDSKGAGGREADTNRREAIKTLGTLLATGSARARAFLRYAESSNVGPLTLEELDERVQWLAEHAHRATTSRLFAVADSKFAEVAGLLQEGHHSGRQRTHLELLAGQFAYYQSRAAFSLGYYPDARAYLRIARHYGELLDHHLLRASVASHSAGIAFYDGRYAKSLQLAQEARQWATPHTAARLAAEEARAHGSMGPAFKRQMADALRRAEKTLPDHLVFEPGAESPFGPEMFAFRAATASVRCGHERAEEFALEAIHGFELLEASSDERFSPEDLMLARLDFAIWLTRRDHPDPMEAARLAIQVLSCPPESRTDPVKRRATELLLALASVPRWRILPSVKELTERVRTYRPLALPKPAERRALGSP